MGTNEKDFPSGKRREGGRKGGRGEGGKGGRGGLDKCTRKGWLCEDYLQ